MTRRVMDSIIRNRAAREAVEPIKSTLAKPLKKTIAWADLPDWRRDNEYILDGYRRLVLSIAL